MSINSMKEFVFLVWLVSHFKMSQIVKPISQGASKNARFNSTQFRLIN